MFVFYIVMYVSFVYLSTSLLYVHALVFLAHIYVDLIVSATNVLVVFLSTINKHFLLLFLLLCYSQCFHALDVFK